MKGRSFRSPVAGFSKAQKRGRSSWMICRVRCTRRSPSSSRRGRRVKTLLYSVQTGEAQIMSKWPRELRERLPRADVGADGRVGFGVDVKRGDFPPQFREGSAHRASPREQLQQSAHRFPCRAGRPATRPRPRRRSSRPARGCRGPPPASSAAEGAACLRRRVGRGSAAGPRASGSWFGRTSFFLLAPV